MRISWYSIGSCAWIVNGLGHNIGDVLSRIEPPAAEAPLNDAMRAQPFDMLGGSHNYYEVLMGISLMMGLAIALAGALLLYIRRLVDSDPRRARQAALIGLVCSLGGFAMSVAFEPFPPIVLFGMAIVAFGMAMLDTRAVRAVPNSTQEIPAEERLTLR